MFGGRVAFRSDALDLLEQGVDSVLRLYPARAGTAITPTSATVTVRDGAGVVRVDAQPATCADGQAAYTVPAATTAPLSLGEGWTVTWSVVLPDETIPHVVRFDAALVRRRLYPVVTEQDLYRRVRSLDPAHQAALTSLQEYSGYLDDAWATLEQLALAAGRRPWLVVNPQALREPHLVLTLQRIFEDEATRQNALAEVAQSYRDQFRAAWDTARVQFTYPDTDTAAGPPRAPTGSLFLGGVMP